MDDDVGANDPVWFIGAFVDGLDLAAAGFARVLAKKRGAGYEAQVPRRRIPIAAGENVAGVFGFKSLIEAGAIEIAQPSVTKIGGIGEMLKIAALCDTHGVTFMPHSPYFGPGFIATLHITAAPVEKPLMEVLWLDMEANPFESMGAER